MSDGGELLSAEEACRRLGVKPATLYTYVSRGQVRRMETGGRRRLYSAEDVDRLAARSAARRGHAAVAVGALRFGEPVLDSAITSVDPVLAYRGHEVAALVRDAVPFERVAELLWEAAPRAPWPAARGRVPRAHPSDPLVWRMVRALPALALADPTRHGVITATPSAPDAIEHERARALLAALAAALVGPARRETSASRRAAERARSSIAAMVAEGLVRDVGVAPLVNAALVACADHELNVSTFAARVAASSGADLYACVGAALYAFTGPRHGAAGDRVEALLDDCARVGVKREVKARWARGEALPGFGHRLYADGDPRTAPLLEHARTKRRPRVKLALELARFVEGESGERANLDLGIVAVAAAMDAPPGAGGALFGLGRVAGWIAHALEQRASPELLRPRARYTGPLVSR